jgi:hypothetical protein
MVPISKVVTRIRIYIIRQRNADLQQLQLQFPMLGKIFNYQQKPTVTSINGISIYTLRYTEETRKRALGLI